MDTFDRIIHSTSIAMLATTVSGYIWTILSIAQ